MHSFQLQPFRLPLVFDNENPLRRTSLVEPKQKLTPLTLLPSQDVYTDAVTSLRICTQRKSLKLGYCIHAKILKLGIHGHVFVGNSLLDMYTKCGQIEDAAKLFEYMPNRTVVSWTSMMSGYHCNGLVDKAISLFLEMLEILQPNEYTLAVLLQACATKGYSIFVQTIHCYAIKYGFIADNFLQNSLIDAYAKSGMLAAAEKLLEKLSCRDVVSWTTVISGCVYNGMVERALILFSRMQQDGVMPNEVTILSILQACSEINNWQIFRWIHGIIIKAEWYRNALVMNSLVEMYSTNGYFEEGIKVYCGFCFTGEGAYVGPETIATLLQGCAHSCCLNLGEEIHGYLIKHGFLPSTVVENSLIHMYGENDRVDYAYQVFTGMSNKDLISWNTMITCLVKNEKLAEALSLLRMIHATGARDNVFPDFITMLMSIQVCSKLSSLLMGEIIHGYITRIGMLQYIFVQNSLIDMYAKSGRINFAAKIFEEMEERDLGSWNSMIAAYGINGNGSSALRIFAELKKSGIYEPNGITFTNVLCACAHAGLVHEGLEIFNCMGKVYGVEPNMEHFACVVDLLGRSGRLEEAQNFIETMPVMPGRDVWGTMLGACTLLGDIEVAKRAAKELSVFEPKSKVWRVALSNVCASAGRWEDAAKLRAEIRVSEELVDEGGWSSVEVRGDMVRFMVGETKHPESKLIYEVVEGIHEQIRDANMVGVTE
ncbi:unnamed protein product [Ilex paraguariensis]|uniref:Pentatricopeptide repeat-containing protein n=1 Tax=Ilex paraguariensis TaxID=185542 RepID=A0ABC8RB76_9AQUA